MCLAVARAISSPKYRATTLSAISMPAEMPAEVSTRPSSRTCFPYSTVTRGKGIALPVQRPPVSGCMKSVQKPGESHRGVFRIQDQRDCAVVCTGFAARPDPLRADFPPDPRKKQSRHDVEDRADHNRPAETEPQGSDRRERRPGHGKEAVHGPGEGDRRSSHRSEA